MENKDTSKGIVKINNMEKKVFISVIADFVLLIILALIFFLTGIPVGLSILLLVSILGVSAFLNKLITKRKVPIIYASILGGIFTITLLFSHIIPYTQQLNDIHSIQAIKDDITLYQNYINKYENEDKVLLKEWAKQQPEIVEKMTALGIQFASSIEPNNVIKKLSDEINLLINLIMERELSLNHLKGYIRARADNNWFFKIPELEAYYGDEG